MTNPEAEIVDALVSINVDKAEAARIAGFLRRRDMIVPPPIPDDMAIIGALLQIGVPGPLACRAAQAVRAGNRPVWLSPGVIAFVVGAGLVLAPFVAGVWFSTKHWHD